MSGVTSDLFVRSQSLLAFSCRKSGSTHLVAKTLGSNNGDLITDSLVGLEVEGQLWVVTLNDDLGGLLDSLSANATHFCGICRFGLSRNWLGMRYRERNSQTFDMVDAYCGCRLAGSWLGPKSWRMRPLGRPWIWSRDHGFFPWSSRSAAAKSKDSAFGTF